MRYILIIPSIMVLLISCNNRPTSNKKCIISDILIDTILWHKDAFLFFQNISDTSYFLIWGNEKITNISTDTIRVLPNGKINLLWESRNAIAVQQGCGTACFYMYILPLEEKARELFFMYPLASDTANNLIAYSGEDESFIDIMNFHTGRKLSIVEDFSPGPFNAWSIDSISFANKKLYVRWANIQGILVEKEFLFDEF